MYAHHSRRLSHGKASQVILLCCCSSLSKIIRLYLHFCVLHKLYQLPSLMYGMEYTDHASEFLDLHTIRWEHARKGHKAFLTFLPIFPEKDKSKQSQSEPVHLHLTHKLFHKAVVKKSSGEGFVGCLTAVMLFLSSSSTPWMLRFESQPTLDTGILWYLQVGFLYSQMFCDHHEILWGAICVKIVFFPVIYISCTLFINPFQIYISTICL